MGDISIRVEHLSKEYRLGVIGHDTLHRVLRSQFARLLGQDDPNSKIGENRYDKNEKFLALDDISFDVHKGEVLGIIGQNGAGKSTLLKILSRITSPTKGKVSYNGNLASLLEVGTGFHPELTGRENVYMNGAIMGMKKWEIDRKFDDIVDFSDIEKFIDTPVKRYSSGMYVRLAFAVAAHLEPDILIVDEVLAVGDANFQKKCLGKMRDVSRNEGRTVLFVSHNMNAVFHLCNTCMLLRQGHLLEIGETKKVIRNYLNSSDAPAEGIVQLTDPAMRKNSLDDSKFKWTEAKILNSNCQITTMIHLGEPFMIELKAIVVERIQDIHCGFGVMSPMGYSMFNSYLEDSTQAPFDLNPGEVKFVIDFPTNYFVSGTYTFDLGANARGVIDWLPEAFKITISDQTKHSYQGLRTNFGGVMIPNCNWKIISKDETT